jgi:hypothetical protein
MGSNWMRSAYISCEINLLKLKYWDAPALAGKDTCLELQGAGNRFNHTDSETRLLEENINW